MINAIIHNDYSREVLPKFEIFSDRLEITSYGGLFEGMTERDFFEGLSLPRNKEIMRIYKDLDMVEQLGSGVPRILQAYQHDCFVFSDNFVRMIFPRSVVETDLVSDQVIPQDKAHITNTLINSTPQVIPQVTPQVENLLKILSGEMSRTGIQEELNLSDKRNVSDNYIKPALKLELIEMTIPDKPQSGKQKYRLTEKGKDLKKSLN